MEMKILIMMTAREDSASEFCSSAYTIMVRAQRHLHFLMKVRLSPLWNDVHGLTGPWSYNGLAVQLSLSVKVDLEVSGVKCDTVVTLHDVCTVNKLRLPLQSIEFNDTAVDYPYLKNFPIHSYKNAKSMVFIGLNNWREAVLLKIKEGKRGQPIASKTRLGWTLQGSSTDLHQTSSLNIHTCGC